MNRDRFGTPAILHIRGQGRWRKINAVKTIIGLPSVVQVPRRVLHG